MGGAAIVPRFRNISTKSDKFLRGYAFNVTSSTGGVGARNFAAFGAELAAGQTPELVVNERRQLVGGRWISALDFIEQARYVPFGARRVRWWRTYGRGLHDSVSLVYEKSHRNGEVFNEGIALRAFALCDV